jgi:TrmH family RNA methyltransferase
MAHRINSLNNPQLRRLKRLHRVEPNAFEFLIEGTHLLTEAIQAAWPLEGVFYSETWAMDHRALLKNMPAYLKQFIVDPQWIKQAATTNQPDGVVAIGSLMGTHEEIFDADATGDLAGSSLTLATDGIQDPGNAGTLLRSVAALGGNRMFLSPDSVSPVHPKFLRSTAGQWFRLPPKVSSIVDLAAQAKQGGVQIVIAQMDGEPIWNMDFTKPTMFIVGSEGQGIRESTRRLADSICSVPMAMGVESLNASVAGTILLYEAARQRSAFRRARPGGG